MGRKRNQGKARRAAKAKAREVAEDGANNNQAANSSKQSLAAQIRQLQIGEGGEKCDHGYHAAYKRDYHPFSYKEEFFRFITAFCRSFHEALGCGEFALAACLTAAKVATMDEFTDL